MKALLYAAIEQAPAAEGIEPHVLEGYFSKFDEKFFHYCDKELAKINTFYSGDWKTVRLQFILFFYLFFFI